MKKIISSLSLIVGVVALAAGATGAYFADTVTASNNTVTSGSLSMTVNGSRTPVAVFHAANLAPGGANGWSTAGSLAGQATIKNTGTIAGDAWFSIENVQVTGGVGGDTSLSDRIVPAFKWNQAPWTTLATNGKSVSQLAGDKVDVGTLAAGQSMPVVVYDNWPDAGVALDNLAQGETLTYDVVFHLDQSH